MFASSAALPTQAYVRGWEVEAYILSRWAGAGNLDGLAASDSAGGAIVSLDAAGSTAGACCADRLIRVLFR